MFCRFYRSYLYVPKQFWKPKLYCQFINCANKARLVDKHAISQTKENITQTYIHYIHMALTTKT